MAEETVSVDPSPETRPILFAPGYFVSSDGHVFSQGGKKRLKLLKGKYPQVALYVGRVQRTVQVHRLVCEAFHGPCPPGHEVRHLDGARTNNNASNLAWGTRAENMADKRRHGTMLLGERNHQSKLSMGDVLRIREAAAAGASQSEIAARHNVTQSAVSNIVLGKTWTHAGMPDMRRRRTRHGEHHMSAKLTEEQVARIREEANGDAPVRDLAKRFGVTPANIRQVIKRETWKHVA